MPNPPAEPGIPAACKQRTISVPMTVSPKLRQRERWGTPAWVISFNRRSRVEASFGLLKNDTTGNVKRDWTRQVGIIKTTLLLAVAVTSSNLRQLLTWSRDTGDVTDPLTRMEVGPAAFEEIDPATGGVENTGPPTAADSSRVTTPEHTTPVARRPSRSRAPTAARSSRTTPRQPERRPSPPPARPPPPPNAAKPPARNRIRSLAGGFRNLSRGSFVTTPWRGSYETPKVQVRGASAQSFRC